VVLLGQVALILALATPPARVCAIAAGSDPDCGTQIKGALAMLGQQKAREAEQLALAATKVCPKEPAAYSMLGMTYDFENRFHEAQTAYRQAISLDPKVAAFHDNLAASYMRSGNQEEAVRELQTALKLDPRNQTANLNLGAYDLNQKDYRRALDHFRAGEAEASGDPGALLGMIQAYFRAGETTAGLRGAVRLSAMAGSDPKIHFSLGLLLAEHGEYPMAVKEFEAIPAPERDFAVVLNLGMARSRLGQFKEARQAYEVVLIDTPPVMTSADAALIGRFADTSLLLVRWGRTSCDEMTAAVGFLRLCHIGLDGIVMVGVEAGATPYGQLASYDYAPSDHRLMRPPGARRLTETE